MNLNIKILQLVLMGLAVFTCVDLRAQLPESDPWKLNFGLGIQTDMHLSSEKNPASLWSGNTYINGRLYNDYLEAGLRFEEISRPLPGHEIEKGYGLPHLYLKGKYNRNEIVIGDVYEQFGSGLLLRLYEDRALGIDNALRGGRIRINSVKGVSLKALAGQQRKHFDRKNYIWNPERGYILGSDLEFALQQWIKPLEEIGGLVHLGASFVSKYEGQSDIVKLMDGNIKRLRQPSYVGSWAARMQARLGDWDWYTEYGYKYNDPGASNNYTYKPGTIAMTTLSYSIKDLSVLVGARRSDNFEFYSTREERENDLRINHLLPFTQQQTYALASLYPYATPARGEWALQSEIRYNIARDTFIGGKYGTQIKISASYIRALKTRGKILSDDALMGTYGVRNDFFAWGEKYFHDFDLEISRKISKKYSFVLTYMNQSYNQRVIEGHSVNGDIVYSNIFIYEGKHKLSEKFRLRTELQYLQSRQADKDWLFGLAELSIFPHFVVSLSDLWNAGGTGKHYYMAAIAGSYKVHRLQLSYGKTRRGLNCSGGVCRMMPATEGAYLSYSLNF